MAGEAHPRRELVGKQGISLMNEAYLHCGLFPPKAELEVFPLPY